MGLVAQKSVLGLRPGKALTSQFRYMYVYNIESFDVLIKMIIALVRKQYRNALAVLHECTDWSAPLLFACDNGWFSCDDTRPICKIMINSKTCVKGPLKNKHNKDLNVKW